MISRLIVLLSLVCLSSFGQGYIIAGIPSDLKNGSDAVILKDDILITIEKLNKVVKKRTQAVAIFNSKGEENFSQFSVYYDKFNKIKKLEATAYDFGGAVLLKSKNSDISDVATDPFNMGVSDGRVKTISLDKKSFSYPYIIEFNVEDEGNETFFLDDWNPVQAPNIAIVESKFTLKCIEGINYRKRELNLTNSSQKSTETGYKVETWTLKNYKIGNLEKYSPPKSLPSVFIEPTNYLIDKYSGQVNTWTDLGNFYKDLNKGRDALPEATIKKVKEIVGKETDIYKKTKLIYEYMQSHTRYFSVSFRLGGWQSLPASFVAEKGYGDCKALTNYTIALLKAAGVKAYPALISAGNITNLEQADFPKNSFNHIIASVPTPKDTIWLECTSQTNPFGYLGSFTGNRKALLIKDEKSELVNTKSYSPEDNSLVSKVEIILKNDGSGTVNYTSDYSGIQHENIKPLVLAKNDNRQKEWIKNKVKVSDITVEKINFTVNKAKVSENTALSAPRIGSISGERLFVNPNILNSFFSEIKEESNERKSDFYLDPNYYSFVDIDSTVLFVPKEFVIENKIKNQKIEKEFGTFEVSVSDLPDNKILYVRKVRISPGLYPKELYSEWLEFLKNVNRADRQRLVFKKI